MRYAARNVPVQRQNWECERSIYFSPIFLVGFMLALTILFDRLVVIIVFAVDAYAIVNNRPINNRLMTDDFCPIFYVRAADAHALRHHWAKNRGRWRNCQRPRPYQDMCTRGGRANAPRVEVPREEAGRCAKEGATPPPPPLALAARCPSCAARCPLPHVPCGAYATPRRTRLRRHPP